MTGSFHARAKQVFSQALDVPSERREAFLAEACEGDEALRREVGSLLAHHREATLLLPPAPRPEATSAAAAPGSDEAVGVVLEASGPRRFWSALWRPDRRPQRVALVGLGVLVVLALLLTERIRASLERSVSAQLETIRDMSVQDIERFMAREAESVRRWADASEVRELTAALAEDRRAGAATDPDLLRDLRRALDVVVGTHQDGFFAVLDESGRLLAWSDPEQLAFDAEPSGGFGDVSVSARAAPIVRDALGGSVVLLPPYTSGSMVEGFVPLFDEPRMASAAPVRGRDGRVLAVLAFSFDAGSAFTDVLAGGRVGTSGETYAVDAGGLLLSWSRFDQELRERGLLAEGQASMLHARAVEPRSGDGAPRPTRAARSLADGHDGVSVDAYPDYRGVDVVGAWAWLESRGFGVITELDAVEAYAPLTPLRRFAWLLYATLAAAVALITASAWSHSRLHRTLAELGQYHLDELIGRGGMGAVYKAHHAMLRRPTAVKLLEPGRTSPQAIARFEREVQLTSELTHPNTVEVYDFGRTPDGVFYYAMEYLPGPSLEELVRSQGALPVARALHLVDQVCASLEEAHGRGLIHRDVKPGNVIVCERGGRHDVAKLLDFGLVTALGDADGQAADGHADAGHGDAGRPGGAPDAERSQVVGTPLYMAPERIRDPGAVDARSDIYSVGALLFKLITGHDVFHGETPLDVLAQVLEDTPPRLAARAAGVVPARLDRLVAACLARQPDDRPASASAVRRELAAIMAEVGSWTLDAAREAWAGAPRDGRTPR